MANSPFSFAGAVSFFGAGAFAGASGLAIGGSGLGLAGGSGLAFAGGSGLAFSCAKAGTVNINAAMTVATTTHTKLLPLFMISSLSMNYLLWSFFVRGYREHFTARLLFSQGPPILFGTKKRIPPSGSSEMTSV
jgi:hypothetical protein